MKIEIQPEISIIIPTLNEEKYIGDTLKSISRQKTKRKFEIIIADSYSTDKTREIAKKHGARIVYAPRGIIAVGRQKGCDAARGKVLVHASADTVYARDWLEKLAEPILIGKAIAVCGRLLPYRGNVAENVFSLAIFEPLVRITYKLKIPFAAADNLAVKADTYRKIGGFDTELVTGEDTDLIKRLSKIGRVIYAKDAVARISMRRARKWGYMKYLLFHNANFLKMQFIGKCNKEYEAIR
ncbi:MAG: glycosyltransferase [Candidatus Micrarchaeota archaeon]